MWDQDFEGHPETEAKIVMLGAQTQQSLARRDTAGWVRSGALFLVLGLGLDAWLVRLGE